MPAPRDSLTAFLPTASASVVPPGHDFGVTAVELRGRPVPGGTLAVYRFIQDAAPAGRPPELPLGNVAAWRHSGM